MEKVKMFYDTLANDEALRDKANALNERYGDSKPDEAVIMADLIAFAKAEGYIFTADDVKAYVSANTAPYPLDDDELEAVAGGWATQYKGCYGDTSGKFGCFCFVGGGNKCETDGSVCACVLGGGGKICSHRVKFVCVSYGWATDA
jgi:predicted ribosomally synthesized peptide with nif11-like leader